MHLEVREWGAPTFYTLYGDDIIMFIPNFWTILYCIVVGLSWALAGLPANAQTARSDQTIRPLPDIREINKPDHVVVIAGSGERTRYKIEVDGRIAAVEGRLGEIDVESKADDSVTGRNKASGFVSTGNVGFHIYGEIVAIDLSDSEDAEVFVDGEIWRDSRRRVVSDDLLTSGIAPLPFDLKLDDYDHTAERYRPGERGDVRSIEIVLPGDWEETEIFYEVIDGLAVVEGDIILGAADDLDRWTEEPQEARSGVAQEGDVGTVVQPLNVVSNLDVLWPGGIIPYELSSRLAFTQRRIVERAADQLTHDTNLNVRPREAGDENYVRVRPASGCSSSIGMQGGRQSIRLSDGCTIGNMMHEFLHAAGVFHEQSRTDRAQHVIVHEDRIQWFKGHNFEIERDSQGLGPYDFGSIMHYGRTAFSRDDCDGAECVTIEPIDSLPAGVTMGQRAGLSSQDIEAINLLYPTAPGPEFGEEWGEQNSATAVAFGDVNGDGRDELAVGRRAEQHSRFFVIDRPLEAGFEAIFSGGQVWGSGAYTTDLAFGDIDGDGRDELAVARRAGSSSRFFVFDDATTGFALLHSGGHDWGPSSYATAVAFGDVDGDGREELAVGRRAGENDRFMIYDDAVAAQPFAKLDGGGAGWGSGSYTTALAFGDVNSDGTAELGVARHASAYSRYYIYALEDGELSTLESGGSDWGEDYYATAIAFGDIDNDAADEFVVGRYARENSRYFIFDDSDAGFAPLRRGGDQWGSRYYAVGVDFADIDGDGIDEVAVARNAGENSRVFLHDDATNNFDPMPFNRNRIWPGGVGATDIALGDADGDGDADIAVSRDEEIYGRPRYEVIVAQ